MNITHNQKKEKIEKKCRKKLRGQIKFQLNLTQHKQKEAPLVSALCEVKNHFYSYMALLQSFKVLKCKLRKKIKY